ncbi:MAG TPA: response regulator [Candidatus Methylomirabilis sp.]|nr:response regulator [Candidatus Methylomirabilis sp.]
MNGTANATKQVLIAEDDDHMREALQEMLSEAGYRVIAAEDGLEALDWLSRVSVDLVIVDILMPGLGGPELIRRLRESSQYAAIPIMLLSGYADLTRYRDLPVNGVQLKPFKLSEFLEKVQQLLGPRS